MMLGWLTMDVEQLPYPWERRKDETARQFAAFRVYANLPPLERSVDRAQTILHGGPKGSRGGLSTWSAKFDWVERALAWDQEKDRIEREAYLRKREQIAERMATHAESIQQASMIVAQAILEELAADHDLTMTKLKALGIDTMIKLLRPATNAWAQANRAERLALGLNTDAIADVPPPPVASPIGVEPNDEQHMRGVYAALSEAGFNIDAIMAAGKAGRNGGTN